MLWWCRATYPHTPRWISRATNVLPFEWFDHDLFGHLRRTLDRQNSDRWVVSAREQLRQLRGIWLNRSFTDRLGLILRLLEALNTVFLIYIIVAQTIGAYSVRTVARQSMRRPN